MDDFYRTVMGHRYYESTLPGLVRQLERLNENLERLIELEARKGKLRGKEEHDGNQEEDDQEEA